MTTQNLLFVGIHGKVLALDRSSGAAVWTRELKGSEFVNVFPDNGELFAATRGEVYRIDPTNGQILWKNPLKGHGFGLATLASITGSSSAAAITAEKHRSDQQNAAD